MRLLRAVRIESGLTQIDVALLLRRPQQWVSQCERGERRVDFLELEDLARVYGRPITYFETLDHNTLRRAER